MIYALLNVMTGQFVAKEKCPDNYTNNSYKIKTFSSKEEARNCQNPLLENIVSLENCVIKHSAEPMPATDLNNEDIEKIKKIKNAIENKLFDFWKIISQNNQEKNYTSWFYNTSENLGGGIKNCIDEIFLDYELSRPKN